jgi:hypothetical protein
MSRTHYDVCLVIDTPSASLAELASQLRIAPSEGSHSRGAPHILKSRGEWTDTVWQCCSELPATAPLESHFEAIAQRCPFERVMNREGCLKDATVYISVGVFSDAQIPTALLTPRCLAIASAYGAAVEVRTYEPDMGG